MCHKVTRDKTLHFLKVLGGVGEIGVLSSEDAHFKKNLVNLKHIHKSKLINAQYYV